MDGWRRKKHTLTLTLSLPSTNPPKKQHSRSPPLTDEQTIAAMRAEAAHLDAAFRSRNEAALVRLISDTVGGATLGVMLVAPSPGRAAFFGAVGRVFSGLSDMAKAFLIIACAFCLGFSFFVLFCLVGVQPNHPLSFSFSLSHLPLSTSHIPHKTKPPPSH